MKLFSRYLQSRTGFPAFLVIGTSVSIAALAWGMMGSDGADNSRTGKGLVAETSDATALQASAPSGSAEANGVQAISMETERSASVMVAAPLITADSVDSDAGSDRVSLIAESILSMSAATSAANQGETGMTWREPFTPSTPEQGFSSGQGFSGGAHGSIPFTAGGSGTSIPIASMGWAGATGLDAMGGSPASAGINSGAQPARTAAAAPGPGIEEVIALLSPDVAHFPSASIPSASIPGSGMPAGTDGTEDKSGNRDMSVDTPLAPPKLSGGSGPIESDKSFTPADPSGQEPSSLLKPDVGIIDKEKIDGIDLVKMEPADLGTARDELTKPDNNPEASRSMIPEVRQQTVDEPPAGLAIGLGVLFFALRRRVK